MINIGANWSPLESEMEKKDFAGLFEIVINIEAHFTSLELEI